MYLLKRTSFLLAFLLLSTTAFAQTSETYFPTRFDWEKKSPEEVGMNADDIEVAVEYAKDNESSNPNNLNIHLNTRTNEPYNNIIGPVKERGPMTGMIIKDGYLVAELGRSAPRRYDVQCH